MNDTPNKPGFTPGEWEVREPTTGRWQRGSIEIGVKGAKRIVAWIRGGFKESKANAHLIAAAPDLYEALEKLVAELDAIRPDAMDEDMDSMPAARAALAKARGESA